ncbi:hypothetical protein L3X38_010884 [Prunus dulcis]|uniref:Retrotransposon gag domain-containing protein n=1 Tax=Prunus dulcis TaxID=3755 RepID=A0AAD4WGD7_PRUDU|nr:hypothetical protein L3X38_010884 [Prunus dulcis]
MVGSLPMNTQPQHVMNGEQSQNGIGRATTIDPNHMVVEDFMEADGGPVLRPNLATSLEIQQLIRAMETLNQLNHQRLLDMAQTIATQNAQISANPPQQNPPVGGNPAPAINVQLIAQCTEIRHREALKLRLFPSTLTGAAFSWYAKLPHNSIPNWQTMEQIFHEQFYRLEPEVSMVDLAKMHQGSNELVQEYLGKFREARARCTVNMHEHEFVKLAQGGLLLDLRKKFEGIEFCDIYDLLLQVDRYEALLKEEQQKNQPTS